MSDASSSTQTTLKALLVDDSSVYRMIMNKVVNSLSGVEVVGMAKNGQEALQWLTAHATALPDLVLLDVEMPIKNGLETMQQIRRQFPAQCVVMVSGTNRNNADMTIEALQCGAFDFIPKPDEGSADASFDALRQRLSPIIRSLMWRRATKTQVATPKNQTPDPQPVTAVSPTAPVKTPSSKTQAPTQQPSSRLASRLGGASQQPAGRPVVSGGTLAAPKKTTPEAIKPATPLQRISLRAFQPQVILVGISTGGPAALMEFIPKLPANLNVPVLIVQHMPPSFTASLAASLASKSKLKVVEAQHREEVKPATVYIAPGGHHMEVFTDPAGVARIKITNDPPVNNCKPAVDTLFTSVPATYKQVLSLIMTGMGRDGADGVKALKQRSTCFSLTQTEATCVVYGMPKAVDDAGLSDEQWPLAELASRVEALLRGSNGPSHSK